MGTRPSGGVSSSHTGCGSAGMSQLVHVVRLILCTTRKPPLGFAAQSPGLLPLVLRDW